MEIYKYKHTEKVIFSQTITKCVNIYILNSKNTKSGSADMQAFTLG